MAVPTLVGAGNIVAPTSGTTITAAWPAGYTPVAGDVAVVVFLSNVSKSVTAMSGYTVKGTPITNANMSTSLWWRRLTGGDSAPAATLSAANSASSMSGLRTFVFRGCVATGDPLEDYRITALLFDDNIRFTAFTTTGPDRLAVVLTAFDNDVGAQITLFPPSGWTGLPRDTVAITAGNTGVSDYNQSVDGSIFGMYREVPTAGAVPAVEIGDLGASGDSEYFASHSFALIPGADLPVDQTWNGSTGGLGAAGTSGMFVLEGGPQTWTGSTATVALSATSGPWDDGSHPTVTAITYLTAGGVTETTAKVKAALTVTGTPVLQVSTSASLTSPTLAYGTAVGVANLYDFAVTGLAANTEYHYGFNDVKQGSFWTAPTPGSSYSFTITGGSCWDPAVSSTNTNAYQRMAARNPRLVWLMGDNAYPNPSSNNTSSIRTPFLNMMALAGARSLFSNTITIGQPSDHDWATDDGDRTSPAVPAGHTVYRDEIFANYDLPTTGYYYTLALGDVRLIVLDCFTFRDPETFGTSATRTMLGAAQNAWLQATIEAAEEPCIILGTEEAFMIDGEANGWDIYPANRTFVANLIEANGGNERFLVIHGDGHGLGLGGGSANSQYATGATTPGPVVICAAPLNKTNSIKGGPWTNGAQKGVPFTGGYWQTSTRQYAALDITASGGVVNITARGLATSSPTAETQVFSANMQFGDPEPIVWTGSTGTAGAAGVSGGFTPGAYTWTGSTAAVGAAGTSGMFVPGDAAWTGSVGTVGAVGVSGAFTPGAITWSGSTGTAAAAGVSGEFTADAPPITWTGSAATIAAAGTTGAFVPGDATWNGSTSTLAAAAVSGYFENGDLPGITWTGSTATIAVAAITGTFTAGAATWQGTTAHVAVTAPTGTWYVDGLPIAWTGSTARIGVTGRTGTFISARLVITGPKRLVNIDPARTVTALDPHRTLEAIP